MASKNIPCPIQANTHFNFHKARYGNCFGGLVLLLVLGISPACAGKKSTEPVKVQPITKPMPVQRRSTELMNKQQQVEYSKQDLTKMLELKPEEIQLSGAIRVTWRSGALGCPEAGMSYTESLTPGVLIMLRVGNKAYRYHGGLASQPFYCPDERAESQYLNSSDS